jgi:hypothetical protein
MFQQGVKDNCLHLNICMESSRFLKYKIAGYTSALKKLYSLLAFRRFSLFVLMLPLTSIACLTSPDGLNIEHEEFVPPIAEKRL